MNQTINRLFHFASAAALTALSCAATADETEIFVGAGNSVSSERPNILFIIDTSGSMDTDVVTQVPFDPATDYPGTCADESGLLRSRATNSSNPPACTNTNFGAVGRVQMRCGDSVVHGAPAIT